MAKIATYIVDTDVQLDDMVIGTDVNNSNITKNYRIGDIVALASGGGKDEGVITIRVKEDGVSEGLKGNIDLIAGNGIELKQDNDANSITVTSLNTNVLRQFGVETKYTDSEGTVVEGAITINSDDNVLILDEPFVGLDQNSKEFLKNFMEAEVQKNKTIIFTSHIDFKDEYREIKINE